MIATDGYATEPMVVDCFVISPGERFDFVMHAASDPALSKHIYLTCVDFEFVIFRLNLL